MLPLSLLLNFLKEGLRPSKRRAWRQWIILPGCLFPSQVLSESIHSFWNKGSEEPAERLYDFECHTNGLCCMVPILSDLTPWGPVLDVLIHLRREFQYRTESHSELELFNESPHIPECIFSKSL